MMDSRARSIVKSLSWRIIAFVTTTTIAWLVTGEMEFGLTIGLFDFLIKFGLYYMHERSWEKVKFGRNQPTYSEGGGI
ncbi:MAG: DUF2061 domain-containing protein [Fibrobacterales bacterium]